MRRNAGATQQTTGSKLKNSSIIHQQWMNQTIPMAMGAGSGGSGSQDNIDAKRGAPYANVKNRLPIDLRQNGMVQNPNGL